MSSELEMHVNMDYFCTDSVIRDSHHFKHYIITVYNPRSLIFYSSFYASMSLMYGNTFYNFTEDLMNLASTPESVPKNLEIFVGFKPNGEVVWKSNSVYDLWKYTMQIASHLEKIIKYEIDNEFEPTSMYAACLNIDFVFPETLKDPFYKHFMPCTKLRAIDKSKDFIEDYLTHICETVINRTMKDMVGSIKKRAYIDLIYNESEYNNEYLRSEKFKKIIARVTKIDKTSTSVADDIAAVTAATAVTFAVAPSPPNNKIAYRSSI